MPRLRYSQQDMYSRWKACGSTAAREKHAALLPYTQSASFRIAWTTRGKGPRRCTVTFQEWNPHVWPSNQKNSSLDSDSVTVRVLPMPASHIGAAQRSSFPSSLRDNAPRPPCPGAPKERTRRGSTAAEVPRPEDAAQAPPGPWFAWPPPSAPAPPHARWQEPLSARPPLTPPSGPASRHRSPPPRQCGGRAGGGRAGRASRHHSGPVPRPHGEFEPPASRHRAGQRWRQRGQAHLPLPQGNAIGRVCLCKGRPGQERQNGLWTRRGRAEGRAAAAAGLGRPRVPAQPHRTGGCCSPRVRGSPRFLALLGKNKPSASLWNSPV